MSIDYHSQRRLKNFNVRKVREALPEFYTTEFPTLVTFLEKYYDFLDSADGTHAFGDDTHRIFATKDIRETPEDRLDNLITEISGGLKSGDIFSDTRYAATRLAELTKLKGSRFSMEEFFRLFFQQKAEVVYGKESIFVLGDSASQIGVESQKFIQNDELYQTFGLLIKTGISVNNWSELYKKYAHPAGFYFAGEVVSDAEANMNISAPLSIADSSDPVVIGEASFNFAGLFTQMTTLYDSNGFDIRQSNIQELIGDYSDIPVGNLDLTYHTVKQIMDPNSFTFDDSSSRGTSVTATPDFSLNVETMDNDIFTREITDSSF
jgi:hypothetical protein